MQQKIIYTFLLTVYLFIGNAFAQTLGKLFIIGGGDRSEALIEDLVKTADLGKQDYIVILPMATSVPEESITYISEQLSRFTTNKIVSFNFSKEDANSHTAWIDSVRHARLIYITGGDQNKFMEVVRDSKLYQAMHQAYKSGSTISGTSAGAAVMSEVMITGGQKNNAKADSFKEVKADYVEFATGMGFLRNVIVDQHFIVRSRYNRLLSILYDHKDKMVVGVDEGTALVVQGNKARVSGVSQVLVIDKPQKSKITSSGKISFEKANLSLYTHGQQFKLK